jgi:flagellar biosynthesis component FlhA
MGIFTKIIIAKSLSLLIRVISPYSCLFFFIYCCATNLLNINLSSKEEKKESREQAAMPTQLQKQKTKETKPNTVNPLFLPLSRY